jgi:hypothetical protein
VESLVIRSNRDQAVLEMTAYVMGTSLGSVANQLGTVTGGTFVNRFAELIIVRDPGSGPVGYPIHLVRDPDGVWRIEGM